MNLLNSLKAQIVEINQNRLLDDLESDLWGYKVDIPRVTQNCELELLQPHINARQAISGLR